MYTIITDGIGKDMSRIEFYNYLVKIGQTKKRTDLKKFDGSGNHDLYKSKSDYIYAVI